MTIEDSESLAERAGLRYVGQDAPGYRRIRRGRGFSYVSAGGQTVNGKIRTRIEALAIPPAWEDVWIARDPLGHIQATGHDEAGRKQYIYHPRWEEMRDEVKFDRLAPLGRGLGSLRQRLDSDLRRSGLPREKVVALAVAVLDRTLLRVGSSRYTEENDSHGLTTLTNDHIEIDGLYVNLEFGGKGGAERQVAFRDRRLARLVARCQELDGQTLFSYQRNGGELSAITSSDVNTYLSDALNGPFTAKDLRTWGASALVTGELARTTDEPDPERRLLAAVDVAAERLGNTRAVCRDSYVHPGICRVNQEGRLAAIWRRARRGKWLEREESALRLLLKDEEG